MDDRTAAREHDADHRFAPGIIEAFIRDVLAAAGLPAADAAKVAELMTEADLTGADAHGVFRLPQYIRRIRAGGFNTKPAIKVTKTAAATALIDGDNAMGHLVMSRAADTAIALAREAGIGWIGVRGSNHAGTAGLYAAMPVAHGMIGLYSAVANANHMAVWGGSELLLGTNPLGIAVPSGDGPVVLDMATTVVSYGTVKKYALAGRDMPEGWLIDSGTGGPLTESHAQRAGPAAADRRLQGQRARHHAGPPGRRAQRRRIRPRRHRLQRR
jgi:L-2-hydroxycarboxylate dehydrogenase (NAD+)